jgi:peroxiredoxin
MRHRFAVLASAITLACGHTGPVGSVPDRVPSQPVVTLTGESTALPRLAEGRVALVSFWATWCEACTREIDSLNRLQARAAERGDAVVIGVAVGEPRVKVESFVRRRDVKYVLLVDEDFRLADALGQRKVPATLVVDRSGRVVYRGDGLDGDGLAAFRKALGDAP